MFRTAKGFGAAELTTPLSATHRLQKAATTNAAPRAARKAKLN